MELWKKLLICCSFILVVFFIVYPNIEIDRGDRLIKCSYSDDFSEFDTNHSYNEIYAYNEKYDVSIYNFDVKKFLCFYTITMKYEKGDIRETQFILEESYIEKFLEHAKIKYNDNQIDIAKLIEGKEAIVSNTRYVGNDYENAIYYVLDGKYEELYVFYVDELLVIQVGNPDEWPRFIAYR